MRVPSLLTRPEFLAGASSGLLLTLSAPPSPLGFLGYVALVPLAALFFSPQRVREGGRLNWVLLAASFGLVHHFTQLHWLMLLGDASPLTFRWALPFMLALLALYLSLPHFLLFWILARLRRRWGAQALWFFPGLWVLDEWARGLGEMGFPWLRLATSQLHYVPMLQVAGLLGELGISLILAWVNVLIVVAWWSLRGEQAGLGRAVLYRWWAVIALVVLLGTTLIYGILTVERLESTVPGASTLTVGVVQGNVDLHDKWDPAKRDSTFVPYTQQTRRVARAGARLVIWPETALPLDLPRAPAYLERVRDLVRGSGVYLLAGFPERQVTEDGRLEKFNSSFLMDDAGVIHGRYRKMHLLPFGERLPFQSLIPAIGRVDFGQAEWNPGPTQTIFEVDGHRFAAMICFESIFSRLGRSAVADGAGFLVNITNDGWFGDTLLPHQHAWMAPLRAAENRVPLLRCANNGLSFAVLPSGRVVDRTGLFERASFVHELTPRPGGSWYTRHGDVPLFLLLAAGFVFLLLVGRQADRPLS